MTKQCFISTMWQKVSKSNLNFFRYRLEEMYGLDPLGWQGRFDWSPYAIPKIFNDVKL